MPDSFTGWIIDDDAGDRKIISRYLERSNLPCRLSEFPSLTQALDAVRDRDPEIAFLDYNMPDIDGNSAVRKLLEIWPDLAIVVVTGQGDEKIAAGVITAGATDYIPKRDLNANAIRRSAENALKLARLRSRVRAQHQELEAFAHVLVHDLAAPIRGVDMLVDVMQEHIVDRDMEGVSNIAQKMQNQARRMSALLKSLRSYAFMDRPPSFEQMDAADIVADVTENLAIEITEAGARIEMGQLPNLYGDRAQLTQLFQNIIANGVKFCRDRAPVVRVSAAGQTGNMVRIVISDNGIGIAEYDLPKMFEPFKRLNHQSEFAGSGLGLATCARIVKRHRGIIRVESTPDVGTEVHLELPALAAALPQH
ncbi:hypothetical protein P775_21650 [Puniceibacterium antarcticum]|uniref:histidine kinase n=1 Tax=Puniceibacterium antarcticum TaxID=1206336 RepID=A0A2G8R921_9RHOB|nr:hybrid sensor histidine kinase/response regulator [Puniceibacterium antarcticum]PIL18029.1 hypothetical protein P775_21650 [Puniceibacterium antarcticum]